MYLPQCFYLLNHSPIINIIKLGAIIKNKMDKFLNRGNKLLKPIGEGMDIETPEKKALTPWV